jgi:FKBP-type peptidyl-prolyl cis-trans isomerase
VSAVSASGVEIVELRAGVGPAVREGDRVTVQYVGKRIDGKIFASSELDGHPLSFEVGLGEVIEGWELGVTGMRAGGKRRLRVPPELAYGTRGAAPFVGANATLIFEVELIRIAVTPPRPTA